MIEQLDDESIKELQLFVEFLLSKKGATNSAKKMKNPKRGFLEGMRRIPIPVDNIIIDRAEIYDERF